MQTHKHKDDSSISPKLVLPTFVWLWLLCKKTTLKRVFFKRDRDETGEREKQIRSGICQLQRFTNETKAVAAYWKVRQYVCAKPWPLTHQWQKQPPSLRTNYLPYLCVFYCEGERERGVEFIFCLVIIWPGIKHYINKYKYSDISGLQVGKYWINYSLSFQCACLLFGILLAFTCLKFLFSRCQVINTRWDTLRMSDDENETLKALLFFCNKLKQTGRISGE